MLSDKSQTELAVIFANLAGAAYKDNNKKIFESLGFPQYKFLDDDGAQGHLGANDREVIITCRGTQPTQINDLLADADAWPKKHGVGWVHSGFRREARKLLDEILNWVNLHKGKDIYITGHSLGAAMALYITQELEWHNHQPLVLFTFGQPRLGNSDYVINIKTPHYRFVNCNDIVTRVPPSALLYKHHGKLCYINYYGNIRLLSRWQRFKDSWRARKRAWSKFQFFDSLYDHSMALYIKKLTNIRDTGQSLL